MGTQSAATSSMRAAGDDARRFFDEREGIDASLREADLFQRLPGLIRNAKEKAPAWAGQLRDIDADAVSSRAALARLPLMRKSELKRLQEADPPFGGLAAVETARVRHVFMSPGPLFEPESTQPDPWQVAPALWAAGIRPGQLLQNCFSYHMTPGAWMLDHAANALGCPVIPAGIGQTEQQLDLIRKLRPDAYLGTPSFLRILIEKSAEEAGGSASSVAAAGLSLKRALVAAEALPPSLRLWFRERGLETVMQWYATAELGCISYETMARDGRVNEGMVVSEGLIVEIVRPGSGDPVPEGEVGEVVVTRFSDCYPMIRLATGDLSCVLPGASPCGRTNMRLKGWMGRADQTTKVRGMFVHPEQIAAVLAHHPEIRRARLVVSGEMANDRMSLRCESPGSPDSPHSPDSPATSTQGAPGAGAAAPQAALAEAIANTVRDITKLRAEVEWVASGSLPNDGIVIEDARKYD